MDVVSGYLLVSDITGYTRFLVESELAHAKEILDTLLKTTIAAIHPPIRLLNTRGDAVMAFVDDSEFVQPQALLEAVRKMYFDFRKQLELMDFNTTCTCQACANMSALDLKLFLHHGEYIEQDLGGTIELQGADVILVNVLMKNTVTAATGLNGYGLITEAAVDAIGDELFESMDRHTESYDHFGKVGVRIWDLPSDWQAERLRQHPAPDPETAWACESIDVPIPPWSVWDVATDADHKRIYYRMKSVERIDEHGGFVGRGSQYHCVHEMGDIFFTITEWDPPHLFEADEIAFGIRIAFKLQIVPNGDGSTIRIMYDPPLDEGPPDLHEMISESARVALADLAELLRVTTSA